MDGARFNPRKKLFFREHRAASKFLVRNCAFIYEVVKSGPGGGYALLGQKPGGSLDGHSISFDGLVLAPEVGKVWEELRLLLR